MAKRHPIPRTLTSTDDVTIAIIDRFKTVKEYNTHSEALEKLIGRAEKLNLHRLDDSEFEALLEAVSDSVRH